MERSFPDSRTVPAGWTAALVNAAVAKGIHRTDLLHGTGVRDDVLEDGEARVSATANVALWTRATKLLGDSDLGLDIATEHLEPTTFGVVGLVAMTSETITDAFALTSRHHASMCGDTHLDYRVGAVADITQRYATPEFVRPPAHAEATLAAALTLARAWSGANLSALQVRFEHKRPPHAERLAAVFGVEPLYGQRNTALVISRHRVTLPLRTSNAAVRDCLVRHVLTRASRDHDEFVDELRRAIAAAVTSGGRLRLTDMAARLGTTARTLQRRLSIRGLVYREVVNDARMATAARLLADPTVRVATVAQQLGYANAAAFRRAFRRWAGVTPGKYRTRDPQKH